MNGTLSFDPDWNAEAAKYVLREITLGVVVYQSKLPPKGTAGCDAPVHYLCPDCFAQRQKSFLQHDPASAYRACGPCRREYFWGLPQQESAGEAQPSAAEVLKNCSPPVTLESDATPDGPECQCLRCRREKARARLKKALSAFDYQSEDPSFSKAVRDALAAGARMSAASDRIFREALAANASLQAQITATETMAGSDAAPAHTFETLAELGKELAKRAKGTMGPSLRYLGMDYLEAYAAVMGRGAGA